ncbi:hypothetical protein L249_5252 [Ophiocordyceps polyrhachis-furcata BCC 54312]|uniref:Uncharacterized protein n=1 Tax=Ophiocordyceps polyrhachis-furcata BCC 54312 TaxID=1330021 RepID=A0A367L9B0_9HYPO|nr:hypothetical protein L249_5252 [Ophiocordyceps polyrhachis-furcata BCC 54312]
MGLARGSGELASHGTQCAPSDETWATVDGTLAASRPVEASPTRTDSLEATRRRRRSRSSGRASPRRREVVVSRLVTQLYTLSHLVSFSLFGTLARLGLSSLTRFPGAPVIFSSVWSNFAGCVVMGFLAEDRRLFRHEWGEASSSSASSSSPGPEAAKAHLAAKKTIPLYIGLTTGFCGSFTSFSSFIRDVFLAMTDDLYWPVTAEVRIPGEGGRSSGRAFMALMAVVIATVSLSLSGLFMGAHLALATEQILPSLPQPGTRRYVDPIGAVLGWGCWLGAVLLCALPPRDEWRGVLFALVFAPLGTLLRFYLALWLNGRQPAFPLGTWTANMLGTAVLAMAWDVAHVPIGGVVGCQVLTGVGDGFCGCLTTISTWAVELNSLRRRHAWVYGVVSVVVAFALLVLIMGAFRWTHGFAMLECH